jgi:type IV pilus assembly protein PilM
VPKDIIEKYTRLAEDSNLRLEALEIESFAFMRSLIRQEKDPFVILDIGGRASSITIVDGGVIRVSHSLDFYGFTLTRAISQKLNISLERAEELKKRKGIEKGVENLISPILLPIIDKMIFSTERAINTYRSSNPRRELKKIILSGGGALLPGLEEYCSLKLQKKVEIGNPFKDVAYPPVLNEIIKKTGPAFSTAVGLAMQGVKL